ncbi:MAG: hypothetical protein SGJ10_00445 [Bacteroidota bacterium]|nr:hypothetical protein [Bacteroidota bacterium]
MGIKQKHIIYIVILIFVFAGCRSKDEPLIETGTSLYPDGVGRELIYQVDSIRIDRFTSKTDTFKFFLRELIESKYIDNTGKSTNRIVLYQSVGDTGPWIVRAVISSQKTAYELFRTEDNQNIMKLVFPVVSNSQWDRNKYNTMGVDYATYINIYEPRKVGKFSYDSTVTVLIQDDTNQIERRYRSEIWGKNIGMLYKQTDTVDYQPSQYPYGILYRMTLINHKP